MTIAISLIYLGLLCATIEFFFPDLIGSLVRKLVRPWALLCAIIFLMSLDWIFFPIICIFSADARAANVEKTSLRDAWGMLR